MLKALIKWIPDFMSNRTWFLCGTRGTSAHLGYGSSANVRGVPQGAAFTTCIVHVTHIDLIGTDLDLDRVCRSFE